MCMINAVLQRIFETFFFGQISFLSLHLWICVSVVLVKRKSLSWIEAISISIRSISQEHKHIKIRCIQIVLRRFCFRRRMWRSTTMWQTEQERAKEAVFSHCMCESLCVCTVWMWVLVCVCVSKWTFFFWFFLLVRSRLLSLSHSLRPLSLCVYMLFLCSLLSRALYCSIFLFLISFNSHPPLILMMMMMMIISWQEIKTNIEKWNYTKSGRHKEKCAWARASVCSVHIKEY